MITVPYDSDLEGESIRLTRLKNTKEHPMMPDMNKIIAWEQGELDEDGTIELFQDLVNSGLAWQLQGVYGRTAMDLINAGLVIMPKSPVREN